MVTGSASADPDRRLAPTPAGGAWTADEEERQQHDVELREVSRGQGGEPIEAPGAADQRGCQGGSLGVEGASDGEWHRANGMMSLARASS